MLMLLLTLVSAAHAEDVWMTQAADLNRWPAGTDANVVVKAVATDEKVQLVTRRGDEVRLYIRGTFGWVDAALITDVAPETEADPPPVGLPFTPR
ncbi:MAG: hypothetical protein H6739_05155 [Alphaproteobacteria bacterium]|nr:hypothetical protein [Alphaproteobacteria bacterium]